MVSRNRAPSGTPTNRSRGSCGWSTRTSAKVGTLCLKTSALVEGLVFFFITNVEEGHGNAPFRRKNAGDSETLMQQ